MKKSILKGLVHRRVFFPKLFFKRLTKVRRLYCMAVEKGGGAGGQLPPPPNILPTPKIQEYKKNDI